MSKIKVTNPVVEIDGDEKSLYISGDTIFFKGINEIAEKLNPTYSLVHVGSAQFRYLTGLGKFTMDAKGFIKTVKTLNSKITIPIHNGGWSHFKENDEGIRKKIIKENKVNQKKIIFLKRGKRTSLN